MTPAVAIRNWRRVFFVIASLKALETITFPGHNCGSKVFNAKN
jgi:hypothetical protein